MNDQQPEALRLADALETADAYSSPMDGTLRVKIAPSTLDQAAAELRRQHDLLGKSHALNRIRADRIKELEQEAASLRDQNSELDRKLAEMERAGKQALEALDGVEALLSSMDVTHLLIYEQIEEAITALRQALADKPEEKSS